MLQFLRRLRRNRLLIIGSLVLWLVFLGCRSGTSFPVSISGGEADRIRAPAVSGQFYPADRSKLSAAIDAFLANTVKPGSDRPVGLVAPHAGYIFSGQIAADAYRQAQSHDYDLVVVLGTNHTTAGFDRVSVYTGEGYRTPLGIARIDKDLAERLISLDDDFVFEESVHLREHSVEVQIPFVQTLFPDARILPAVMGSTELGICGKFGRTLAKELRGRKALIVASSDLSHYPDYTNAQRVDRKTLEALSTMELDKISGALHRRIETGAANLGTYACGAGPILAAVAACREMGAQHARVISYANSGDISVGSHDRVVGYGAVAFYKTSPSGPTWSFEKTGIQTGQGELTMVQKKDLLALARETIHQYLISETVPVPRAFEEAANRKSGVFVTLKKEGELRGCVGRMVADLPLPQAVGISALRAAFGDVRFPPVRDNELEGLEIEISVLTEPREVQSYSEIEIGRDGIILEKEGKSAVFLPQVAVEQHWDLEQTLDQLSHKAGLTPGAWKKGAKFRTFQALVFSESELHTSH